MQNRRILVLGASGRIGGILRKFWSFDQVLWQTRARSGPGWVGFDPLAQPQALVQAASGCDVILCLAGVVTGRPGRGGALGDNIALGEAAVRAGAVSGATVFLASSAAVYGNQIGLLEESAPLRPINAYGRAKADMEARARTLAASLGVQVCALRIGNIAGLDAILGGWKPGFRLDRFADGRTPRRSYIGVATLARVLGDLMGAKDLPADLPDALNIACPGTVEMGALLDAAGLPWVARPAPEETIKEVCLSTRALARITPLPDVGSADTLVKEWHVMKEPA